MVGALAVIIMPVWLPQSTPATFRTISLPVDVSVSIPVAAKPDPQNRKQTGDDRLWAYYDGNTEFDVEILSPYEKTEPGTPPDQAVAAMITGMASPTDDRVIKVQHDITLNGWLGLEAIVSRTAKDGGRVASISRAYVVGTSAYAFSVTYSEGAWRPATTKGFMDSISIGGASKPGRLRTPGPVFTSLTPKDGSFSVEMPSTPKEEQLTIGKNQYKSLAHRFTSVYGNRVYIATFIPFPAEAPEISQGEKNESLGALANSFVNELEGKALGQPVTVKRDDLEFVRVECARLDGLVGRIEATVAARHFYITVMIYPSGHAGSPDIETFFNSFKLLQPELKKK